MNKKRQCPHSFEGVERIDKGHSVEMDGWKLQFQVVHCVTCGREGIITVGDGEVERTYWPDDKKLHPVTRAGLRCWLAVYGSSDVR